MPSNTALFQPLEFFIRPSVLPRRKYPRRKSVAHNVVRRLPKKRRARGLSLIAYFYHFSLGYAPCLLLVLFSCARMLALLRAARVGYAGFMLRDRHCERIESAAR